MTNYIKYIQDEQHYTEVLSLIRHVKRDLWIGTADLKDVYTKHNRSVKPLLSLLSDKVDQGIIIRLIHAKEPGRNFKEDFDKYPNLWKGIERVLCPRVHFKIMVFDMDVAYIGSANLTGAGMGMKSEANRNFEAGILTNNPALVENAVNHFDSIWMGTYCKACKRKTYCGDPVVK